MKKQLLLSIFAVALIIGAGPRANAQSAFFTYTGMPGSAIMPGGSFTISVFINFTSGGNINNLAGFSYWMWQSAGTGFPFAITNRDVTGSIFTDLQSNLTYPQIMDPINRNPNGSQTSTDLGALFNASSGSPQPSGQYFVARLTFSIAANVAVGSYTISNTTQSTPGAGGRVSVITNSNGDTFPIAASPFTILIPEPSTSALLAIAIVPAGVAIYRRQRVSRSR